jgi:hypothetical protein
MKKKNASPDGIGTRSGSRNPWENFIPCIYAVTLNVITGEGKLVPRHAMGFHTVWAVRARQPQVWATRQCMAGMIDAI